jgi:uncharacterized protein YggE
MKKIIGATIVIIAACYFLPWKNINWGRISTVPVETVTVNGQAQSVVKNQIAGFSAGVSASNNDKATAVNEVNSKMTVLVKAVKDFGIKETDIQTQQASVYQEDIWYVDGGVSRSKKGQWTANNSIEITLRNVDQAQQLTDLLNTSGATNVYGPNFRMDDTNQAEKGLYALAMKDAMDKADIIARASGRKLGRVLTVSDNGSSSNIVYPMMAKLDSTGGGAVPAPVEAGSTTVTKNLTVSFELD